MAVSLLLSLAPQLPTRLLPPCAEVQRLHPSLANKLLRLQQQHLRGAEPASLPVAGPTAGSAAGAVGCSEELTRELLQGWRKVCGVAWRGVACHTRPGGVRCDLRT